MWRSVITLAAFLASLITAVDRANAQQRTDVSAVDNTGLHVYVLTFGPGDEIWEKFGHNAIRMVDDKQTGDYHDVMCNWGMFSFDDGVANFAWHFLQGKMIYSMGMQRSIPTIEDYTKKQNRTVLQQELNLSAEQKLKLWKYLNEAVDDPALRTYRYDYFTYNCSSRVRDTIDDLVDHRLAAVSKDKPSGASFRFHADRLTAASPWAFVLLEGAMGHPVDRPIDRWQEMFLPEKLHDRLNDAQVHVNGYDMPLVMHDQVLYQSTRAAAPLKPPVMAPWFLVVSVLFGAILAGLSRVARRHWAARWTFVLLSIPWLLLMGIGGGLLWFLWLATDHVAAGHNENVMHVSVLALPLIVLIPMVAFGRRWGAKTARNLTFAIVAISMVGLLLKALPWFYQVNWSIIAFCLPVNIALAYAVWFMAKSPKTTTRRADDGRNASHVNKKTAPT